jgi:hypothetical protein
MEAVPDDALRCCFFPVMLAVFQSNGRFPVMEIGRFCASYFLAGFPGLGKRAVTGS